MDPSGRVESSSDLAQCNSMQSFDAAAFIQINLIEVTANESVALTVK